jgi:hypothetical protein
VTFGDPLEIFQVDLAFVHLGEAAAQACEEELLAQFGEFHRFLETLLGGHASQDFKVSLSIFEGFVADVRIV